MSLAQALLHRRAWGRAGFVPFVVAGEPSLAATGSLLRKLELAGCDIIELGVPFSDPVADGPVIQAASQRSLAAGTTLEKIFALMAKLRRGGFSTPVVLFSYLNPLLRLGEDRLAAKCVQAGIQGVLIVDLPAENAQCARDALKKRGVEIVLLASPSTSDERLKLIGKMSGSIVYYVSREGVTGARKGLSPGLKKRLDRVKKLTGKPLITGFGVSTAAQVRALAPISEGVVVGSALVSAGPRRAPALAKSLVAALRI